MPVCGNYLFFELPKKIVLNPKDGKKRVGVRRQPILLVYLLTMIIVLCKIKAIFITCETFWNARGRALK